MVHKISICNLKGGVGKTLLSTQLAMFLSAHGKRVLLVDADYQGNTTSLMVQPVRNKKGILVQPEELPATKTSQLYEKGTKTVTPYTVRKNLDLIWTKIADADLIMCSFKELKEARNVSVNIKKIEKDYDYVIFDCPPSLGTACAGPLLSSDWVLVPMCLGPSIKESIAGITETFHELRKIHKDLKLVGYMVNRVPRVPTKMYDELMDLLKEKLHGLLFENKIRSTLSIQKAGLNKEPIWEYPYGKSAYREFVAVFDEMLTRIGEIPLGPVPTDKEEN